MSLRAKVEVEKVGLLVGDDDVDVDVDCRVYGFGVWKQKNKP